MTWSITEHLGRFAKLLEKGVNIECCNEAEWCREGVFMHFIRWLFGWEDARIVKVAAVFNRILDDLEQTPVKFKSSAQSVRYGKYLRAADAVKSQLKTYQTASAKEKLLQLNLRIAALKYRLELENKGLDKEKEPDANLKDSLTNFAKEWKKSDRNVEELLQEEMNKIDEVSRYPEYSKLLIEDSKLSSKLRELFFKWALRDNCEVDAIVQFPVASQWIKKAYLGSRIGRFAKYLKLVKYKDTSRDVYFKNKQLSGNILQKEFVLPFEVLHNGKLAVKEYSILNPHQAVKLNKNYKIGIGKIIDSFANRAFDPGNFEMLGPRRLENGKTLGVRIANHHTLELGPYDPKINNFVPPDLSPSKKKWWKQLPPLDTLDKEDLKKMYGLENIEEGKSVLAIKSTSENPGLDVDGCHGYIDILIPLENGGYELYSFGKYAAQWPANMIQKALFVTYTTPGRFECPDESHFMSQREHANAPIILNEEQFNEIMEKIRIDLLRGLQGKIAFQFAWANCAHWCQQIAEKCLKTEINYFRLPTMEAEPRTWPLPLIFRYCKKFEGEQQNRVVKRIEFMLLSWRGFTIVREGKKCHKSLTNSKHMNNLEIHVPSLLNKQIKEGKISGFVTKGNHFERLSAI